MLKELQRNLGLLKKESSLIERETALAITVTTQELENDFKIFPLRYFMNYVCLPIGIKNIATGIRVAKFFDGKVNTIFVDAENKLYACENLFDKVFSIVKRNKVYPVKGNDFTADSAFSIIFTILKNISRKKILMIGAGNIGSKVALKLIECGAQVFIINSTKLSTYRQANAINVMKPIECKSQVIPTTKEKIPRNLDCIVGFTRGVPVITNSMVNNLKTGGLLLDGGTGTISQSGINEAKRKKIMILRLDIRIGFAHYASFMLSSQEFVTKIIGKKKLNGFNIVSGGIIGEKGDIVVDNIKKPTRILGIANGAGRVLRYTNHNKNADIVKRLIN
ncbi:MAG: hypothetical protein AUI92_03145 [Thaumarchaeota archaeon 13_1_40CM_3_38_6]|nr:MAG: hypothetical protein AUI92_03145 [Thaumarchaeota archaeon 13_1_40CM_3_38_6]